MSQHNRSRRYREIVGVLIAFGFDEIVAALDPHSLHVAERVRFGRRIEGAQDFDQRTARRRAARLRLALEELGPAYIKLGQALASRADLMSPEIVSELSRLQDRGRAVEFAVVAQTVERELGDRLTGYSHSSIRNPLESPRLAKSMGRY